MKYLITYLILFSLISCSGDKIVSDGGTDTESGGVITGALNDSTNLNENNISLSLFPEDYRSYVSQVDSTEIITTSASPSGVFNFSEVAVGNYNLIVSDSSNNKSYIIDDLQVLEGDTIKIKKIDLGKPGQLKLNVPQYLFSGNPYLYIPGTPISKPLELVGVGDTSISINNVPPGSYKELRYTNLLKSLEFSVHGSFVVTSDGTINLKISIPEPRLSGTVTDLMNYISPGVEVILIPLNFSLADSILFNWYKDTTDNLGYFQFSQLGNGNYNLIARHLSNPTIGMVQNLNLSNEDIWKKTDTLTLNMPGNLKVFLTDTLKNLSMGFGLEGTDLFHQVSQLDIINGFISLNNLPKLNIDKLLVYQNGIKVDTAVLENSVMINPNTSDSVYIISDKPQIEGSFVMASGQPAIGIDVNLYKIDNITGIHTLVGINNLDNQGIFRFRELATGNYFIEASSGNLKNIIQNIGINDQNIFLKPDTLVGPGALSIRHMDLLIQRPFEIHLQYSNESILVDSSDPIAAEVVFTSVPQGNFKLLKIIKTGIPDIFLSINETITTGDTAIIEVTSFWKKSKVVRLSNNSLNLSSDVIDIPLLIRLDNQNFDFNSVLPGGRDIRFLNNGKALPFEIETWDEINQQASIWVLMDRLELNSPQQNFTLLYENSLATEPPDLDNVFSSNKDWAGVWHLNESQSGTGNLEVYQNSVSELDKGDDYVNSLNKNGVTGRGEYLNDDEFIQVSNASSLLKPNSAFTLSAWIKADDIDSMGGIVMTMGDNYLLWLTERGWPAVSIFSNGRDAARAFMNSSIVDSNWHMLSATYENRILNLYMDGTLIAADTTIDISVPYTLGPHFRIGRHGYGLDYKDFIGGIDEVRVSSVARNLNWIKASFINQNKNSNYITLIDPN